MNIQKIVILLALIPNIVAFAIGTAHVRQLNRPQKMLWFLTAFALFIEVVSRVLWFYKVSNMFLLPFYTIVEFCLLFLAFKFELKSAKLQRLLFIGLTGFLSYSVFYLIFIHDFSMFSNYHRVIESALLVALAILYYYQSFQSLQDNFLEHNPMFWVSTGILIYFSGNLFIFLFGNYMTYSYNQLMRLNLWVIHAIFNIILYTLYAIALWSNPVKQNSSGSS